MKKPIPFGKYFLMDRIAVGGMAEVFKAKTFGVDGFEKVVAMKRILPNIAEDEEFITMFTDEAKIAVKLSHANIVQIFQLGQEDGSYFIAMEYIQGRDLRTIFDRSRRKGAEKLDPKMVAYIIARTCEGLDYAHRKKDDNGQPLHIVHRDISPQNILLSYEGDVKVIDFGVAKAQNKMGRTQAGILKGKFAYMSPEQIQGLPLDQRSDIFALGVVFYEVLTGSRLFVGESDFHTLEMIRNMKIKPPSSRNSSIPPQLDEIALKALARDPNERYTYASEMHEDLQRFLYSHPPIYTRQLLSQYMRSIFSPDIDKEKQRSAAYEPFFQHMRDNPHVYAAQGNPPSFQNQQPIYHQEHSGPSPMQQNSQAYFNGGVHQTAGNTPSHTGSHPGSGQFVPPQPVSVVAGANPYTPTPPPIPSYQQQGYGSNSGPHPSNQFNVFEEDDSTLFDPNGQMIAAHAANAQLGTPTSAPHLSPYGAPAAEQSPYAAPLSHNAELPPLPPSDYFVDDAEGESDTIIDLSITEEKPKGNKKLWIVLSILLLLGAGTAAAVLLLIKPSKPVKPFVHPPGKLYVVFRKPVRHLKFYLDNKPFPFKQLKAITNRRIQLTFAKGGKFKLKIVREGYQTITQPVSIEAGDEMQTPFLKMIPLLGSLKLETKPEEATVFVDGMIQKGQTPLTLKLAAGPHQIQIMKRGRTPWEERVIVKHSATVTRSVKLQRTKALLTVVCRAGAGKAKIYINGRYKGKTPREIRLNPRRTYRLRVKPRKYRKQFKTRVSFPLSPKRRISVDCIKPKPNARGYIRILSAATTKVWIDGKYRGKTPLMKVVLKPGEHQARFVNVKTKELHKVRLNISTGSNPPIILNQWKK